MNNGFIKTLVIVLVLLYIISPVDACPGIIDDVIIALVAVAVHNRLSA